MAKRNPRANEDNAANEPIATRPSEWPPERIKDLRVRLGFTLAEMAEKCGVKMQSFQAWCNPVTAVSYKRPSGLAVKILDRLDEDARLNNPLGIDLLTERQRDGKALGGMRGTATRVGRDWRR